MSLFPTNASFSISGTESVNTIRDRGINFLFDFNTKEFVLKDGKLIQLSGDASVVFWIEKTLRTEYERSPVYWNTEYGFGIERFIGVALPPEIIKLQFEDNLKRSLLQHERIKSINNFYLSKVSDSSEVAINMEIELNSITETEESFASFSDGDFITLTTVDEIKDFVGVKLITNNLLLFKTNLGEQIYVKM